MKNKLIISFTILTLFSCKYFKNDQFEYINNNIVKIIPISSLKNSKYCIIIPKSSCGGCISSAIRYIKDQANNIKNISIIFTGIEDRKRLNLELGQKFLANPNVYLDSTNIFQDLNLKSVYPKVYLLKEGIVIDSKELSLDTSLDMATILNDFNIQD